jgi:hypothetical protein
MSPTVNPPRVCGRANPVSLVRHEQAYILGQAAVARKTNETAVAPGLQVERNLTGAVTPMDVLLTQQRIAQHILPQGGLYLMIVKKNANPLSVKRRRCCSGQPLGGDGRCARRVRP